MRIALALGVLLAMGCQRSEKPKPATAPAETGAAAPSPTAPAPCNLAGDYRLRFASNGADGWWWRLKVTGTDAELRGELVAPVPVLGIESAGPVQIRRGEAGCTMAVTASGRIGDMIAALVVDESTGKVTGQLTRAKPRDADEQKPAAMAGVRAAPGAKPGDACVAPGTYELTFDPRTRYRSDTKGEDCSIVMLDTLRVRLEYLGPDLYGDTVDEQGKEAWPGSIVIKSLKGCDVELEHQGEDGSAHVTAKLTFADGKVTGTATEATYRILEDGEAGENMWNCTAAGVALTGRRL